MDHWEIACLACGRFCIPFPAQQTAAGWKGSKALLVGYHKALRNGLQCPKPVTNLEHVDGTLLPEVVVMRGGSRQNGRSPHGPRV